MGAGGWHTRFGTMFSNNMVILRTFVLVAASLTALVGRKPANHALIECHLLRLRCPSPSVSGTVTPEFEAVRTEFEMLFKEGREEAAQVAVFYKGQLVVDLWGGEVDGLPISGDEVIPIFSATKVAESLVLAMLAKQGQLSLDAPIAAYWPEFGESGNKQDITVSQLM